ncbi:MAG: DNA-binding transcriptional regulator, partial [Actinobacteria bacterium HGW-Actinobacteria-5]
MDPEVYAPSACIASRAAELYFVEGASQREICDRLGVSVSTVSRLVNRAREESLVSIAIAEPYASCLRLERDLKAAYHLKEVLVPPNLSPD